ncbi:hypothetical protein C8R44DRAFT_740424 [Mycena epipterygia]|nr:hypothetical protein C8R44DRAFT_740424 [Mycena epipterygia]
MASQFIVLSFLLLLIMTSLLPAGLHSLPMKSRRKTYPEFTLPSQTHILELLPMNASSTQCTKYSGRGTGSVYETETLGIRAAVHALRQYLDDQIGKSPQLGHIGCLRDQSSVQTFGVLYYRASEEKGRESLFHDLFSNVHGGDGSNAWHSVDYYRASDCLSLSLIEAADDRWLQNTAELQNQLPLQFASSPALCCRTSDLVNNGIIQQEW